MISDWTFEKVVVDAPYRYSLETAEYSLVRDPSDDKSETDVSVAFISMSPLTSVGGQKGSMTLALKVTLFRW
jgi:hypothetical protein